MKVISIKQLNALKRGEQTHNTYLQLKSSIDWPPRKLTWSKTTILLPNFVYVLANFVINYTSKADAKCTQKIIFFKRNV